MYAEVPHKFEAGTVNAGGAVGLEAAIHYIAQIGFDRIQQREEYLSTLMLEGIKKIPHVHLLGADTPEQHHGIFSFTVDDVHPHDVSAILADAGIAVRAGHHCAQPLLQHLGVNATTRASLAFYNTEEIIDEQLNAGKSLADARHGGSSGCVETGCWGYEAYPLTGYFNLPKILEVTLNNGVDPRSGKMIGIETGDPRDFETFEELFDAYKKQVKYFEDVKVNGSNINTQLTAKYNPVPYMSLLTEDCIARGEDYNAGGARYNTTYLQGVGIGSITDALSSLKYNVYDEKRFTMDELLEAIGHNFEGEKYQLIRNLVSRKTPKFGNDDDYADDIMRAVFRYFHDTITGRPNMRRGEWRIDMLPTTCHVYFGEVMNASPNGRLAHKPVSEGISPEKGADIYGPTGVINSCAKMDQLSTGGTLLNQKFTPSVLAGDTGLDQFANLIRAYFNMDGHHIQFNVIDRKTLLAAQANPEEYKDLIVRVAGYSDHFRNLSKELQDEIINRTEQSFDDYSDADSEYPKDGCGC